MRRATLLSGLIDILPLPQSEVHLIGAVARYEKVGWPLGSGAVEGGCRLIGARTNGCGRRWCEKGCHAIVALRGRGAH